MRRGQYLFGGLYIISQALIMAIYQKAGAPAILLPVLASSKRLHSIYALRMFNDGVAMTIMFSAILLLANHKYRLGTVVTSLALSVKMNILLFVPALAVILFRARGFWPALVDGLTLVLVQVLISLPFTLSHPVEYFSQAFDLSRVFSYKWTVNLRFLPEDIFLDKRLSIALLSLQASFLIAFGWYKWTGISRVGATSWFRTQWSSKEVLSPRCEFTQGSPARPSLCGIAHLVPLRLCPLYLASYSHRPLPLHLEPDRHHMCPLLALPVLRLVRPVPPSSAMECQSARIDKVSGHYIVSRCCASIRATD